MMHRTATARLIFALGLSIALGSCSAFPSNPTYDNKVKDLGDDYGLFQKTGARPDLVETEFHRGGQPCVSCHGAQGDAKQKFVLAGTVYYGDCNCGGTASQRASCEDKGGEACNRIPASDAVVTIQYGAEGSRLLVTTNCAGNFFVDTDVASRAELQFPLLVSVATNPNSPTANPKPPLKTANMFSHISREGSCAGCHEAPAAWDQAGQISFYVDNKQIPADFQDTPANRKKVCAGKDIAKLPKSKVLPQ
jgi:cytochrome c553